MTTGKRKARALVWLAAALLAAGGWTPAFADNLTPDSPYSQPGQTATNQSGTPSGSQPSTPSDMDKFNSEFHNSFQNLMPDAPPPGYSTMMGKWVTTMYGFVQVDTVYDSNNSYNNWPFNAAPANAPVVNSNGSTVDSPRFGMDVNNSRIGFALSSPVYNGYKIRALLEMDFLASPGGQTISGTSPGSGLGYVTNPIFRIRHFFFDVTTPSWGNVLVGQYWSLFGWQPYNIQNNLQIAPGPGTAYGRFPQIRWYKILHMDELSQGLMVEPAVAVMTPPTTTGGIPAFTEGLKLSDNHLMTEMMIGDTGKGQFPASIGISGIETNYSGYISSSTPSLHNTANTGFNSWTAAGAVDLVLPIIPIHNDKPGNNLTLQAEYTWGQGDAWQFPNLSFGLGGASVNTPGNGFGGNGVIANNGFLPLDIQTYNADLQYYFPDDARTSIVVGFAVDNASNLQQISGALGGFPTSLGGAGSTNGLYSYLQPDTHLTFAYVDLWHDFTPAVRAGLEFGQYDAVYVGGANALDNRVMMSWFYLF